MPKTVTTIYTCTQCDAQHPKWMGQCATCGAWGTLTAQSSLSTRGAALPRVTAADIPLLNDVPAAQHAERIATGIGEFDLVLGGGLVPASLLLLAGEPGIGKSTLVLQAALAVAAAADVLYISGEETGGQVRSRAERLGKSTDRIRFAATNDAARAAAAIRSLRPALAIVDSVQTLGLPDLPMDAGGVAQVRSVTSCLLASAKESGVPVILIGHVTKDGAVAGPKTLEHLVDQVIVLEGEATNDLRVLRTSKNRYGPTDVVGVFTMHEHGLVAAENPSTAFRGIAGASTPGTAVIPALHGNRTLLVEVQALVTRSAFGQPQRRAAGVDLNRLHVLLAVLAKYGGVALGSHDVHVATVGGYKLTDPAADLGIITALASAANDVSVPFDLVAGEVGLDGSIRNVRGLDRRLPELVRIGCRRFLVPEGVRIPSGASGATLANVRGLMPLLSKKYT